MPGSLDPGSRCVYRGRNGMGVGRWAEITGNIANGWPNTGVGAMFDGLGGGGWNSEQ